MKLYKSGRKLRLIYILVAFFDYLFNAYKFYCKKFRSSSYFSKLKDIINKLIRIKIYLIMKNNFKFPFDL